MEAEMRCEILGADELILKTIGLDDILRVYDQRLLMSIKNSVKIPVTTKFSLYV